MPISEILLKVKSELSQTQIDQFKCSLNTLNSEWDQADIEAVNSSDFAQKLLNQFDSMLVNIGYSQFDPDDAGQLIHELYLIADYKSLIEYIVLAYRKSDDVLEDTYALILQELRGNFEDYDE